MGGILVIMLGAILFVVLTVCTIIFLLAMAVHGADAFASQLEGAAKKR